MTSKNRPSVWFTEICWWHLRLVWRQEICVAIFTISQQSPQQHKIHHGIRRNGEIPFLDILIKRCPDNAFMTSVYWKKTFSRLYTKWDSFTPRKYKVNLIRSFTYRCFRICSSPTLLQFALSDLRKLLLKNGYPQGIINYDNDVLKKNWNRLNSPVFTVQRKIWSFCHTI